MVELVELVVDVAVEVEDIVVLMGSGEIPKHWHSEQYNVLIFSVQQSPPSNWHSKILVRSSQNPSPIQTICSGYKQSKCIRINKYRLMFYTNLNPIFTFIQLLALGL